MNRKGARRYSTGDIKIGPTNNSNGNNSSRANSPNNSSRSTNTPRNSSSRPGPPSLRKKTSSILARANSFQGNSVSSQKTKKVKKTSVYSFNLSKDEEKLETQLISQRSKSMRRSPGPDPRELRSRVPRKNISQDIDKMVTSMRMTNIDACCNYTCGVICMCFLCV